MKITRKQLRQIIKETIETHPGHGDADGDGVKDFADTDIPATWHNLENLMQELQDKLEGDSGILAKYINNHWVKQNQVPGTGLDEMIEQLYKISEDIMELIEDSANFANDEH